MRRDVHALSAVGLNDVVRTEYWSHSAQLVGGHQKTSFFWTSAGSALAAWQSLGRMQSGVVPSRRWDRILARVGKSGYPTRREGWGMHTGRAPGESVGRTMVGRAGKQSGTVQSPAHVVLGVGMAARKAWAAVT